MAAFDPNDPGPEPPELTPQEREQRKADEKERAPRNEAEANFVFTLAEQVLGENDDEMRDRYQVRDGAVRAEGHDTTRVGVKRQQHTAPAVKGISDRQKAWREEHHDDTKTLPAEGFKNKRAEPYITAAHKIAPPPRNRSEVLPRDPTPRREPSSIFVDRFEPPKDIHTEIEDALELHGISRESIAVTFGGGRPKEARKRARRLLRDALLDLWAKGRSAKLIADDLGCSRQALETLMGNAPRGNLA